MFQREKLINMCIYCHKTAGLFPRWEYKWPHFHPQLIPILDQIIAREILFLIEQVIHASRVQNMHSMEYKQPAGDSSESMLVRTSLSELRVLVLKWHYAYSTVPKQISRKLSERYTHWFAVGKIPSLGPYHFNPLNGKLPRKRLSHQRSKTIGLVGFQGYGRESWLLLNWSLCLKIKEDDGWGSPQLIAFTTAAHVGSEAVGL